jgi:hypothetical protein
MKMLALALVMICLMASPVAGSAKCVSGQPPDYDDISAVLFQRNGCAPYIHDVMDLSCSSYWMYVTNWGSRDWGGPQREVREYSQFNVPGQIGTFSLNVNFKSIESILQRHKFFDLSPPYLMMSEQTDTVLTVKRCAVATRLMMYSRGPSMDKDTASLFADLDAFVANAEKTRISDKAQAFSMGGLL